MWKNNGLSEHSGLENNHSFRLSISFSFKQTTTEILPPYAKTNIITKQFTQWTIFWALTHGVRCIVLFKHIIFIKNSQIFFLQWIKKCENIRWSQPLATKQQLFGWFADHVILCMAKAFDLNLFLTTIPNTIVVLMMLGENQALNLWVLLPRTYCVQWFQTACFYRRGIKWLIANNNLSFFTIHLIVCACNSMSMLL